eukprot:361127-Chlamydomonas_euryale.AAC.2
MHVRGGALDPVDEECDADLYTAPQKPQHAKRIGGVPLRMSGSNYRCGAFASSLSSVFCNTPGRVHTTCVETKLAVLDFRTLLAHAQRMRARKNALLQMCLM